MQDMASLNLIHNDKSEIDKFFYTKLKLNLSNTFARRDAMYPYEMHRTLCRLFCRDEFSIEENRKLLDRSRILFRVEKSLLHNIGTEVIIFSRTIPNLQYPCPDYLMCSPKQFIVTKHVLDFDTVFSFQLFARPCKFRNGRRVMLKNVVDQRDWLLNKAENGGFIIKKMIIEEKQWIDSKLNNYNKIHAVEYSGVLEVSHKDKFFDTLMSGIGPSKGYGFGLLKINLNKCNFS